MQNLLVVVADKSKFEPILGRVDVQSARACASVEVVNLLALDAGEIDGLVQCLDDTIVTIYTV